MRRLLAALVLSSSLALLGSGVALAAPASHWFPEESNACKWWNAGDGELGTLLGFEHNQAVPMQMTAGCMIMPWVNYPR